MIFEEPPAVTEVEAPKAEAAEGRAGAVGTVVEPAVGAELLPLSFKASRSTVSFLIESRLPRLLGECLRAENRKYL